MQRWKVATRFAKNNVTAPVGDRDHRSHAGAGGVEVRPGQESGRWRPALGRQRDRHGEIRGALLTSFLVSAHDWIPLER